MANLGLGHAIARDNIKFDKKKTRQANYISIFIIRLNGKKFKYFLHES